MLGLGTSLVRHDFSAVGGEFSLDQIDNMIAWYKFDTLQVEVDDDLDGTNEVNSWTSSVGQPNPITQSIATRQPSYNNAHLSFDASQQQKLRAIQDFGIALRSFTIMFCIKPASYSGNQTLMGNQDIAGNFFRFNNSNTDTRLKFNNSEFDATASQPYPLTRFILTITRSTASLPNKMRIYSGTTEVVAAEHSFGAQANPAQFDQFGCQAGQFNPYDGEISEVAIWGDVLSDDDRNAAIADMELRTGV